MTRLLLHSVFPKMQKPHGFIHVAILLFWTLFTVKGFIHSFAIIRNKNNLFKIFFNQYNVSSFGNCSSKKVLMIANVSYCFTLVKANELQKVQVLLLYIPLVTGIIQFVNISVSKPALNYLHELRFRFLWESCTLKRITRRWWSYPKFTEKKSKMAKKIVH